MYSSSSSVSVPSTNKTVALKSLIHVFTYIHRAKTKIPAAPRRSRPGKNASASTRGCMNTPAKMKNKNENAGARVSVVCEKASRPESRPLYALGMPSAPGYNSLTTCPLGAPYAPLCALYARAQLTTSRACLAGSGARHNTVCACIYLCVCVCVCVCVCMCVYIYIHTHIYI